MRPKAFLLLRYLAEHPERLVSQEELLKAVWQHSHVSDGLVRGYIRELRQVLGDDAKAPRFIETASGRGYRFIVPVTPTVPSPISSGGPAPLQSLPGFVGRQEDLAQLHGALECARRGERQMVFVTGEAGIGKTALIDAFLAQVAGEEDVRVGRGQCIGLLGAVEAYLPLIEALGGLARRTEERALIPLLRRQAPTWLVQMPAFIEEAERDLLNRRGHGATPERMARELSEALEALTAESPLILWLEDLHWGDPSTVDLLAMLARRREPARLLVLGTYRPADVIASAHPLRALVRELEAHAQCRGLPLGFLTSPEVTRYLAVRFAPPDSQAARLEEWGRVIHRRTDGNPLFMVAMVEDLLRRGVIGEPALETSWPAPPDGMAGGLPESLRQLVDHQLERLSEEERRVLEAASVAGLEFSAGWVAAAMDTDVLEVEGCCEALARRHLFLSAAKEPAGPKRRLTERYRFLHALYPQILYQGLPAARRRQLHRRVGASKETAFGNRSAEIAAELAVHFEEARDASRAVRYLGQAAQNALRRSAGREAADLLTRALEQLQTLPETPERAQQELSLQASLGAALLMSRGYTAPEVKHAYDRAHALSGQAGESPQLFPALFGLFRFELLRGELRTARSIAAQSLRLAQAQPDPFLVPAAQAALGAALFHLGEPAAARAHVEEGLRAYDRHRQEALLLQLGEDPGVVCLRYAGFALQVLGYPDQALARSREARALAEALSHPFSLVGEVCSSAFLYRLRRDVRAVQAQAETALDLVSEHALPVWGELAALARGWALAEQGQVEEGIAQMRHALGLMHTVGFYLSGPQHLVLPAEAYGRAGQANEGFGMLEEALATAQRTGERWYEAELYRLNGELMLQQSGSGVASPEPEAEACFLRSVDIARSQEARLFELRAAMSLARLRQQQGKDEQAYPQLAEVYGWFTEGFDTKDLQEARELLETSGGAPSCRW